MTNQIGKGGEDEASGQKRKMINQVDEIEGDELSSRTGCRINESSGGGLERRTNQIAEEKYTETKQSDDDEISGIRERRCTASRR